MEPDGVICMSDLEERLKGEEGSALRGQILSRLTQLDGVLGERVAAGLRPDDFARATDIRNAVQLARKILRGFETSA